MTSAERSTALVPERRNLVSGSVVSLSTLMTRHGDAIDDDASDTDDTDLKPTAIVDDVLKCRRLVANMRSMVLAVATREQMLHDIVLAAIAVHKRQQLATQHALASPRQRYLQYARHHARSLSPTRCRYLMLRLLLRCWTLVCARASKRKSSSASGRSVFEAKAASPTMVLDSHLTDGLGSLSCVCATRIRLEKLMLSKLTIERTWRSKRGQWQ